METDGVDVSLNAGEPVDIFEIVLSFMKNAQSVLDLSGAAKKTYVMSELRLYLGAEVYERYSPIISLSIDLIKRISHDKKILDGLESLKKSICVCL